MLAGVSVVERLGLLPAGFRHFLDVFINNNGNPSGLLVCVGRLGDGAMAFADPNPNVSPNTNPNFNPNPCPSPKP